VEKLSPARLLLAAEETVNIAGIEFVTEFIAELKVVVLEFEAVVI